MMEEFFGYLMAFVAAAIAIMFIIWTAVAAIVRVFAWVLVFWALASAVGLVVGVLVGFLLPLQVLRGRSTTKPDEATPNEVVAGRVLGMTPKGAGRHFGWDPAWPVYNPHQAKRDANAVIAHTKQTIHAAFDWLFETDPVLLWLTILLPPVAAFAAATWLTVLAWYLVMALLGGLVYLLQQVGIVAYRGWDRATRWWRKASLQCAMCYRVTVTPSYRCLGDGCLAVHHDLRPGALGIIRRRCGCGARLPTTVRGAAKHLVTVCPFCQRDVPTGSGTRRVLPVPVIGAVGAGKTQFLSSGVVELARQVERHSGSLTPISPTAQAFMDTATLAVSSGQRVPKTSWEDRPEGIPLALSHSGKQLELHLMDAAGENFADWERSKALSYVDTAEVLVFILDPLALPVVKDLLQVANKVGTVPVAVGSPNDSYASVVDRLRAEDVRLSTKRLAVVVSKVDVLRTLPGGADVEPSNSDSIRRWLNAHGADGLIRRIDRDFKRVTYFAIDSFGERDGADPLHPLRVFDWVLQEAYPRATIIPQPVGAREGEVVT